MHRESVSLHRCASIARSPSRSSSPPPLPRSSPVFQTRFSHSHTRSLTPTLKACLSHTRIGEAERGTNGILLTIWQLHSHEFAIVNPLVPQLSDRRAEVRHRQQNHRVALHIQVCACVIACVRFGRLCKCAREHACVASRAAAREHPATGQRQHHYTEPWTCPHDT